MLVIRYEKIKFLGCLLTLIIGLVSACSKQPQMSASSDLSADLILTNGRIYTSNLSQPWVEAVAINDGKFSFVGSAADVQAYKGDVTQVIDLSGKMAMPGLNDLHVHPVAGFTVDLFECTFPGTSKPEDIERTIKSCLKNNPDAEWIVGGQWETDFFIKHDIASPTAWLDRISADKAVILRDTSFHNHWANSKALALAGLTKQSAEIPGGVIVRDSQSGEPTGILLETAVDPVIAVVPNWTKEQYLQAAQESIKAANRFGITGFKDASVSRDRLEAYKAVDDAGQVSVHIATAITLKPDGNDRLDKDTLQSLRTSYRGKYINTDFVKLFMDGVPSAGRTAAMLEDYLPAHEGAETTKGLLLHTFEDLAETMVELDRAGYTVKIHTAGDRSVRVALDAIEVTRQKNGNSGLRHELAHAGFIHDDDIARFRKLNAVAEVSPYIWFPSVKTESIIRAVGERGKQYWPVKSLLDAGAEVVVGSDWPAGALPDMNPWVGLEALVSRRNPWGTVPGALWPAQAITLDQALRLYTVNGAKGLKLADVTGSIETGKLADMIVLKHNLFDIPVEDISETEVELTLFEGKVVYQQ